MNPREALEFTNGDKEKIKFLREVKAKQRALEHKNVLQYINDKNIIYGDKKASEEETEKAIRRENIRDKKLEKYFNGKVAVTDEQQKEADRLMKIEEKKMRLNPDYIPKIIDPENIKIAKKIPVIPPRPDLPNGHSDWTTDDWLESIDAGGWASDEDKKVQVEENLMDKYLELLKAGELIPGTTFEMFQKNFYDFDTEVFTKIKKRAKEKKRVEGLAALLGVSPGRIKI